VRDGEPGESCKKKLQTRINADKSRSATLISAHPRKSASKAAWSGRGRAPTGRRSHGYRPDGAQESDTDLAY
jgi:DNA-binding protein H-NS